MKTLTPKPGDITQAWYIVDATGMTLGRLSTKVASILAGKNKPYYVPNIDCGDYVVIINAEKVRLSGLKNLQKVYQTYSGYPSGRKEIPFCQSPGRASGAYYRAFRQRYASEDHAWQCNV